MIRSASESSSEPTSWYNRTADQLRALKRERRRAERRWHKSKLTIQKEIYEDAKRKVAELVDNAKTSFYSAKIQASKSSKNCFVTSNAFLDRSNVHLCPLALIRLNFRRFFVSEFSTDKIRLIRINFPGCVHPLKWTPQFFSGTPFKTVEPVTELFVCENIQKSVPKTCELDQISTSLLY